MKEKTYVIDTNIILDDPYIVKRLKGNIIIPTTVLQELDSKKFGGTEKNRNAREFARIADKKEIKLNFPNSDGFSGSNDYKIIGMAKQQKQAGEDVVLVTNDIYMSILAESMDIPTMKGEKKQYLNDEFYSGIAKCNNATAEVLDEYKPKFPNKYYITKSGILKHTKKGLNRLGRDRQIWGIKHKNAEQRCAIDALLDDDVHLVTLSGKAGTGKTLLAIAAGLEKAICENKYHKVLVSRPVIPMGQDIGYLPGDINDKLGPWMQPIFDNIDFLFNLKGNKENDSWMQLEREGLLKLEPLTYIRGRSIPNQFMIIDEAQNLTKHEVKTILSRAGEGTKIILTGDPNQIDNPRLDSTNNGLSYAIERFKDQEIAAHITLTKCERSALADISAEIL